METQLNGSILGTLVGRVATVCKSKGRKGTRSDKVVVYLQYLVDKFTRSISVKYQDRIVVGSPRRSRPLK